MKPFKIICLFAIGLIYSASIFAQDFQEKDGMKYLIIPAKTAGQKPVMGQTVLVDLVFYGEKTEPVFSSLDKNEPVPIPISVSQFKGDLMEGLLMMGVGDSAVFLIKSDSIIKITGNNSGMTAGSYQKYIVKLRSIYDPKVQMELDVKKIRAYLKEHKIKGAKHTSSGLYYTLNEEGKGEKPKDGQTVSAHYTGKFLEGVIFDSDKGKGFSFVLGKHEVIQGWEEGFALMKKGCKATLYLPSTIAYGVNGGGSIPANAVLVFDVELTDIK